MLQGDYKCRYCLEECANDWSHQLYSIPSGRPIDDLYFCTPECAAGFNYFLSPDAKSFDCAARHTALERKYHRRIPIPPAPQCLARRAIPRSIGIARSAWLQECRKILAPVEWDRVRREEEG